jgi:pyruvate dehydrogenase E2 component (dihydrolipoamide acetyltransferase)
MKIKMPEVAAGATHAVISKWLVAVGAEVVIGQVLVEIETDKAVVEYSAEESGTLIQIVAQDGEEVEVGSVIAEISATGAAVTPPTPVVEAPVAEPKSPVVQAPVVAASPVLANPVVAAPEKMASDTRKFVSPIARKLAKQLGVDLSLVSGTGPNGRVVRRDVEQQSVAAVADPVITSPPVSQSESKALASQDYSSSYSAIPHSPMRKAIARRLTESKSTVPHFYLTAHCQVDELLELRKRLNEASSIKISVNDMVIRAVAAAFQEVPQANVVWQPDHMLRYESVDLAVAVATDGGLLTPVIRGVEKRSLSNIASTVRELAERSRAGKLRQDELEGGSFAITNLGMFGTEEFSAIINPPQSGILAVGAASERAVVVQGQLAVRTVMTVTLSADHRAVDGALAAQWLSAFQKRIENPLSMLI